MKKTERPTREELHKRWQLKYDKCKLCVNASECKMYQNGVMSCRDFKELSNNT